MTPAEVHNAVQNVARDVLIDAAIPLKVHHVARKFGWDPTAALKIRPKSNDPRNKSGIVGTVAGIAGTVVIGGLGGFERGAESSSSYVYQLVNEAGEPVYYGISNNPLVRLGQHARTPPGPFSGMQVISKGLPLAQAQALETSLIQQANAEGRLIYNVLEALDLADGTGGRAANDLPRLHSSEPEAVSEVRRWDGGRSKGPRTRSEMDRSTRSAER